MLHEHQRTCAPKADSVSISTAVWIVMCSEPTIFRPFSGWALAYSARTDIRPGISCSASRISLRPQSASFRSATLNSNADFATPLPAALALFGFDRVAVGIVQFSKRGNILSVINTIQIHAKLQAFSALATNNAGPFAF